MPRGVIQDFIYILFIFVVWRNKYKLPKRLKAQKRGWSIARASKKIILWIRFFFTDPNVDIVNSQVKFILNRTKFFIPSLHHPTPPPCRLFVVVGILCSTITATPTLTQTQLCCPPFSAQHSPERCFSTGLMAHWVLWAPRCPTARVRSFPGACRQKQNRATSRHFELDGGNDVIANASQPLAPGPGSAFPPQHPSGFLLRPPSPTGRGPAQQLAGSQAPALSSSRDHPPPVYFHESTQARGWGDRWERPWSRFWLELVRLN